MNDFKKNGSGTRTLRKEFVIKFPSSKEYFRRNREKIEGFRQKLDRKRKLTEKVADEITEMFGSFSFFFWNGIFFFTWIILNINIIPGVLPFDPYPFGLLTMIVSLEAIFLSIFVLLSQNRQAKIADLREEVNLQIDMIAEKEITKLIQMQVILMKSLGIRIEGDEELEDMMRRIDTGRIQAQLEKEEEKNKTNILHSPSSQTITGVIKRISKFFEIPGKTAV